MTEPQPPQRTDHRQAYAVILARWEGGDAALDALPPEHRMPVIRALIDTIDTQRRLTEHSRRDFLDDYAAEINAAHTLARLDAEIAGHLPPRAGAPSSYRPGPSASPPDGSPATDAGAPASVAPRADLPRRRN